MLTAKIVHLLFVISWMATLFYLPRILVHYSEGRTNGEDVRRLLIMGEKLYGFSLITAVIGFASGGVLWLVYGISGQWLYAKLGIVSLLIVYELFCVYEFKRIRRSGVPRSGKFYRIYNEVSVLLLLLILILVIMKPNFYT